MVFDRREVTTKVYCSNKFCLPLSVIGWIKVLYGHNLERQHAKVSIQQLQPRVWPGAILASLYGRPMFANS